MGGGCRLYSFRTASSFLLKRVEINRVQSKVLLNVLLLRNNQIMIVGPINSALVLYNQDTQYAETGPTEAPAALASISSDRVPHGHLLVLLFDLLGIYTVPCDATCSARPERPDRIC